MAATSTRATKALDALGIDYERLTYDVAEKVGSGYGQAVAAAIGLPTHQVYKTLIAEADDQTVAAIIPVSERLSTKLLGRAVGAKRSAMAAPEVAERMTGYVLGGVSPFGQRRRLPTFVDISAASCDRIAVSGGRRGLQLLVALEDLLVVTDGTLAPLVA